MYGMDQFGLVVLTLMFWTLPCACNLPPSYYLIKFLTHSWQRKAPEATNTLCPSFMYSQRQDLCKSSFQREESKWMGVPKKKFRVRKLKVEDILSDFILVLSSSNSFIFKLHEPGIPKLGFHENHLETF